MIQAAERQLHSALRNSSIGVVSLATCACRRMGELVMGGRMTKHLLRVVALLGFVLAPATAHADLIFLGTVGTVGSGIGSVATVLTLDGPANSSDAEGYVRCDSNTLDGVCNDDADGDLGPVAQTRSFAEAGITTASEFRLIFNANEGGNDGEITLVSLVAYFYNSSGILYHTAEFQGAPVTYNGVFTGQGEQGLVFGLDVDQATEVQSQFNSSNRIGIAASLSDANGGFDAFNVSMARGDDVIPSPEPAVLALFGIGLFAVGFRARRRKTQ